MKTKELYKRFKLNPKMVKPGDLMKAASKRKAEGKGFPRMYKKHKKIGEADQPSMANWKPPKSPMKGLVPNDRIATGSPVLGNLRPSTMAMAKANKMCKSCGKAHSMGKHIKNDHDADDKHKSHKKGLKLVPPSKGHKPKGAHGRAAVKQLGRTKTTGNFARIEATKGKGAAVSAFQNARRARNG